MASTSGATTTDVAIAALTIAALTAQVSEVGEEGFLLAAKRAYKILPAIADAEETSGG
mgnify:CR=1 FL=1